MREVLLGTRICLSNSASLVTRDGCVCYIEGCLVAYSVSKAP